MPTMKDVAKEAQVALGTVSNVLNNRSTVSLENRMKVLNAVKKLNYRTNFAARTLKTNASKSIGLIIPDITNPFYPELARGAEDSARKNGYTLLLCNTDRNVEKEREYIQVLIEKNVDGIIIVKSKVSKEEIESACEFCSCILVDSGSDFKGKYNVINVDEVKGIFDAMQLLYDYGHRRIAFISGLLESASSLSRQDAYLQFLKEKGLSYDKELVKKGSYDWYSGYTCTVELLRSISPPTAILAANDLMAIGAMKAITERRLHIPFDISVMGIDDIDMASLCTPTLTSLRQPKYEMGVLSVEKLINRIEKKEDEYSKCDVILLKAELVLRDSVGYKK